MLARAFPRRTIEAAERLRGGFANAAIDAKKRSSDRPYGVTRAKDIVVRSASQSARQSLR